MPDPEAPPADQVLRAACLVDEASSPTTTKACALVQLLRSPLTPHAELQAPGTAPGQDTGILRTLSAAADALNIHAEPGPPQPLLVRLQVLAGTAPASSREAELQAMQDRLRSVGSLLLQPSLLRRGSSIFASSAAGETRPDAADSADQQRIRQPLAWAAARPGDSGLATLRTLSDAAALLQVHAEGRPALKVLPALCLHTRSIS